MLTILLLLIIITLQIIQLLQYEYNLKARNNFRLLVKDYLENIKKEINVLRGF
jgi:hypothetical protein